MTAQIRSEVARAYDTLAQAAVQTLKDEIATWSHQPNITHKIDVTKKQWTLTIIIDEKSEAGKIYKWVSEGTGERSGLPNRTAYTIRPKNAGALYFNLPATPASTGYNGEVAPSTTADPGEFVMQEVHMPGIYPRHLGKDLYDHLKSRRPGSFRNVTEAAIKRGLRKLT
jgi:hypothetical protein